MAEFTAARNNALPYPVYGAPYTIIVPLLDGTGAPISPSSPDSEIAKNCDTAVDCTNEVVEISGLTGICYLALTATELTADLVAGETSSTGAKTTPWAVSPRKLVTVRSGTAASAGSATDSIVLDSGASDQDDYYNGMLVIATIDSVVEARIISDYVGSTKTASVVPDWNTAPDNNDTFVIKLPEGVQINQANVTQLAGNGTAASNLSRSAVAIYRGSVTGGSPTSTTLVDSGLTQADTDHWNGRILIFTSGNLKYQATSITGFTPASDTLTFAALTNAPAASDEYVIL